MKCVIIFIATVFISGFFGYCTCAILGAAKVADMQAEIYRLRVILRSKK